VTRIAMVHDNFQGPTGMGLMCQGLAEAVLDAGWSLTIVGTDVPADLAARADVRLVRRYDRLPALPQHVAWCAAAARALRRVDADVVHVHSPFLLPLADLLTAHFIARPAYARGVREDRPGVEGLLRRAQEALTRWLDSAAYRWGARRRPISFVSEFLRDEFRAHYGEPIGGWIMSPPAPAWQPVSDDERAAAKRRWRCDGERIVAGYLGGSDPRKGLLEARSLVSEPDIVPLVAGPGTDRIDVNGHPGHGFVDPGDLLEACDVFVGPARFDSAPVAVLQALARGVPVAVSETSGWSRAVERHGAGSVWRAGTPFADAVRQAALAPKDSCREVVAEFSRERQRQAALDIYAELARRPRS
jgi:glycosyltransferase involved in cell wall biosynthesis